MNEKKGFPEGSVCKPCWELKYCPYGYMVEWSPLLSDSFNIEEYKQFYRKCLKKFLNGDFESEEDVWKEVDRLLYLNPSSWEFLSQFDPKEIGCQCWHHVCPVFINQSVATETKEGRRQGRYIPREIMLKVVRRDNQICQKCYKNVRDDEIEFDHIIPLSKGGPTNVENIRLLCRDCNRKKSNSIDEITTDR
ncbi:HNH endonuclease signature motif containing protein [Desulfobacula sp.]|uniref:HNH endonuclease n=1 Tax=Desulfobacula sp. TaxID=2593537 RepID=UPI0026087B26|nr:HNH endonuclease signature motif containing protein [Desulfobacula sp.]